MSVETLDQRAGGLAERVHEVPSVRLRRAGVATRKAWLGFLLGMKVSLAGSYALFILVFQPRWDALQQQSQAEIYQLSTEVSRLSQDLSTVNTQFSRTAVQLSTVEREYARTVAAVDSLSTTLLAMDGKIASGEVALNSLNESLGNTRLQARDTGLYLIVLESYLKTQKQGANGVSVPTAPRGYLP